MVLRPGVRATLFVCLFASVLPAQQDRIATAIDARYAIGVRGSVPRQAQPKYESWILR
jgi:hypothetical protein